MDAQTRMTLLLERTGLYDLDQQEQIAAELAVCGARLEALSQQADKLLAAAFFDEADNLHASWQEQLFGFSSSYRFGEEQNQALRLAKIAAMKQRLSITNRDFSKAGVQKALQSYGLTAQLVEHPDTKTVEVQILADEGLLRREEQPALVQSFLPCHSTAIITYADS